MIIVHNNRLVRVRGKANSSEDLRSDPLIVMRNALADRWYSKYRREMLKQLNAQVREASKRVAGGSSEPVTDSMETRWTEKLLQAKRPLVMRMVRSGIELTDTVQFGKKAMDYFPGVLGPDVNPFAGKADAVGLEAIGYDADDIFLHQAQTQNVEAYLQETSKTETATSRRKIDKLYKDANSFWDDKLKRGLTPREVAKQMQVQGLADNAARATMMSRTTTMWAYNEGATQSYINAGIPAMSWVVSSDDQLCEFCVQMDGQMIRTGDPFLPAGTEFPGLDGGTLNIPEEWSISHPPLHPMCFIDGQVPIYTSKGWKPIRDVKKGTLVLTHKGRFKKITQLIRTPKQTPEVVKISFHKKMPGRSTMTITANHPVLVNGKWKAAGKIKRGDDVSFMASECKRCCEPIPYYRTYCSDSCRSKDITDKQWADPKHRKNMSKKASAQLKREYKFGIRNGFKITKEAHKAMGVLAQKGKHPSQKLKNIKKFKEATNTPEQRKQSSLRMTMNNPSLIPEVRKRMTKSYKETMLLHPEKHPNFIMAQKGFMSSLEKKMKIILDKLGVEYVPQYPIKNYFVDFAIPSLRIAIEVDGAYWHQNKKKDTKRQREIEKEGWHVLRYSEKQINECLTDVGDEVARLVANHKGEYKFTEMKIVSVKKWKVRKAKMLYNFSVAGDESYVAKGFVVHNCRCTTVPIVVEADVRVITKAAEKLREDYTKKIADGTMKEARARRSKLLRSRRKKKPKPLRKKVPKKEPSPFAETKETRKTLEKKKPRPPKKKPVRKVRKPKLKKKPKLSAEDKKYLKEYDAGKFGRDTYADVMQFDAETIEAMRKTTGLTPSKVKQKISTARRKSSAAGHTKDKYFKNGEYTAKRQALHDKLVKKYLRDKKIVPEGTKPKLVVTGGYPGSGKSTMRKAVRYKKTDKYVQVDSDDIKKLLAKADGIENVTWQAQSYHLESDDILKRIMSKAKMGRKDIIFDGTMKSKSKMLKMVADYKKAGYEIEIAFADLSMEKAMQRAISRFLGGGRFVDPAYIASHGKQNIATLKALKRKVTKWAQWSTDVPVGRSAELIAQAGGI